MITPEKMIEIEPRLAVSKEFVEQQNKKAKNKRIYWFNVWSKSKELCSEYVGFMAKNDLIKNSECYDTWHDYLKSIATNCKY